MRHSLNNNNFTGIFSRHSPKFTLSHLICSDPYVFHQAQALLHGWQRVRFPISYPQYTQVLYKYVISAWFSPLSTLGVCVCVFVRLECNTSDKYIICFVCGFHHSITVISDIVSIFRISSHYISIIIMNHITAHPHRSDRPRSSPTSRNAFIHRVDALWQIVAVIIVVDVVVFTCAEANEWGG